MNKLIWAVPLLLFVAISLSSAAAAFEALEGVSLPMKATWRLQISGYATGLAQLSEWISRPKDCLRMWKFGWQLIILTGIVMGLQYTLFTVSLGLTSMTHCLLLNTMCPVIFLAIDFFSSKPLYKWEVIGVLVSMIGISLVAFDVLSSKSTATWFGDVLSFLTAVAACGYLMLCKHMLSERNSPLLSFFAPINFVSCLTSYALAVLFDPTQASEFFGWTDSKYLGLALYLGVVPGFLGMISLNFLLLHISMILITVFINLEPLFGSFIGWIFGYEPIPTPMTWLGGAICICGNMVVTLCGSDSQEKEESKYMKLQETSISEL